MERRKKLRVKNDKLNDQRKRRSEKPKNLPRGASKSLQASGNSGNIHPSRRNRVAIDLN